MIAPCKSRNFSECEGDTPSLNILPTGQLPMTLVLSPPQKKTITLYGYEGVGHTRHPHIILTFLS